MDVQGKVLLRKNIDQGDNQIFTGDWAEGLYFYRISASDGQSFVSGKLMIVR
jgi:hypothetical protein